MKGWLTRNLFLVLTIAAIAAVVIYELAINVIPAP